MSEQNGTPADKGENADVSTDNDTTVTSTDTGDKNKGGLQIPKHRFDEEVSKRKAIEKQLNDVADAMLESVPETFKALIPEGMTAQQKIDWYNKASASGVFAQPTHVPATDKGTPGITPKSEDYTNMTPAQKIAAGYKK